MSAHDCKARSCSHRHNQRRVGADLLDGVKQNADYWLNAGRSEAKRDDAVIAVEQAMNAWRNAAYAMAERVAKLEAAAAAAHREAA